VILAMQAKELVIVAIVLFIGAFVALTSITGGE
jgi:hypothetical protein